MIFRGRSLQVTLTPRRTTVALLAGRPFTLTLSGRRKRPTKTKPAVV